MATVKCPRFMAGIGGVHAGSGVIITRLGVVMTGGGSARFFWGSV